jgi:hypothetical protein
VSKEGRCIEALQDLCQMLSSNFPLHPGECTACAGVYEVLCPYHAAAALLKEHENDCGWISITDRLPTHIYSVLGWIIGPIDIVVGKPFANPVIWNARRGKWQCGGYDFDDIDVEVTHWQPLPLGPKPRSKP